MSNTTCRRAEPPRVLKSRRISPSPPPPQTPAAFCAAWRFGEGAMGGGALLCIVWLWMWMWFWGIYIPNCYGSGTTRARGAPHGWFAPHGDGREGVFGSLPFMARSSMRPVSGDSLARVCPSGQTSCRLMRTECRFAIPGVPCNTFTAHPAAPLGSRAAKRRPVSFALCRWRGGTNGTRGTMVS